MFDKTAISALSILANVLTDQHDLPETLKMLTAATCQLMGTTQSAVLLHNQENHQLIINALHGIEETENIQIGQALHITPRLDRILWKLKNTHRLGATGETGINNLIFPLLGTPLKIKGKVVGLLITADPINPEQKFGPEQRKLYTILATLTSLAIERAKTYHFLNSKLAQEVQKEMYKDIKDGDAQDVMIHSMNNPEKVVKLLATSFYKELNNAGFNNNHVVVAAAQMLDCIMDK